MVKTRKAMKRPSPKGSKEEPPDSEEKKPKLEACTTSKYFSQKNGPSTHVEPNFDSEGVKRSESSESVESLFRNKSKSVMKIDEDSDSDGSSSDEFMKAPISLDDLGGFETLKKGNKTPMKLTGIKNDIDSTVGRLSDSDEVEESNEQELYDFSQIIKSQELLKVTKKEQEEKSKQDEENLKIESGTLSLNKPKSKVTKSSKKAKKDTQPDLKSLGEELGISELLAIAEGQHLASEDDSECDINNKEINPEENYSVPKEGVQITVELPNMVQLKKKKGYDVEAALKRRINLIRKENQVFMHKVHTLCWIAHGIYLNRSVNNEVLMGLALSLIPSNHCYPKKQMDLRYLEKLVEWFVGKIVVVKDQSPNLNSSYSSLVNILELQINSKKASSERDLVLIFVCILRSLGINARLVINLRSVPIRPPITDLCSLSNKSKEGDSNDNTKATSPSKLSKIEPINKISSKKSTNSNRSKKEKCEIKTESEIKSPYFSSSDDLSLAELVRKKNRTMPTKASSNESLTNKSANKSKTRKTTSNEDHTNSKSEYFSKEKNEKSLINKRNQSRNSPPSFQELGSSSEDEVFQKRPESRKKPKGGSKNSITKTDNSKGRKKSQSQVESSKASTSKSIDRRVLSTDDEDSVSSSKIGNDYWAEVFVEEEEKWISVDLQKGRVHCINQLYKKATQPVRYVLAWNNDGSIKDVTRRYAPQWLTVTRRQRAEEEWWSETMAPYTPARTAREREEDEDLDRQIHDQPLPSSIADYKNHPLFALKRHLLKFQAIYPPDAPPLGFIKDEPVYSRGCVVELHTRETWIKEAKLVRRGEEPYKIVKARPKYDKLSGTRLNDLPLPLFGFWQVEDYIPPPAVDGKVPRNEYGNVELYKPCMLPPGTVHLQVPGLARVARKLDIDCAPAVVGWEFSGGGSHPVLDGFIVCEEFRDILLDAWNKEIDESAKRAREKVEQRVYGNWKRLIKGLLIRERLKLRYDFGDKQEVAEKKKKKQSKPGTSKS